MRPVKQLEKLIADIEAAGYKGAEVKYDLGWANAHPDWCAEFVQTNPAVKPYGLHLKGINVMSSEDEHVILPMPYVVYVRTPIERHFYEQITQRRDSKYPEYSARAYINAQGVSMIQHRNGSHSGWYEYKLMPLNVNTKTLLEFDDRSPNNWVLPAFGQELYEGYVYEPFYDIETSV